MRPSPALLVPALAALLATASCTSTTGPAGLKQPPVSSFAPGPCRTGAAAMLEIGRDVLKLGKGPTPPQDVRDRLTKDQELLSAMQPDFDAPVRKPVGDLVVQVGFVRLRSVTNTYAPELADAVSLAYHRAVAACTVPRPTASVAVS